jgi:hypothetical protein
MNYFVWERELDMSKYSEDNEGNYRIQLAKKPKQKTKKTKFWNKMKIILIWMKICYELCFNEHM